MSLLVVWRSTASDQGVFSSSVVLEAVSFIISNGPFQKICKNNGVKRPKTFLPRIFLFLYSMGEKKASEFFKALSEHFSYCFILIAYVTGAGKGQRRGKSGAPDLQVFLSLSSAFSPRRLSFEWCTYISTPSFLLVLITRCNVFIECIGLYFYLTVYIYLSLQEYKFLNKGWIIKKSCHILMQFALFWRHGALFNNNLLFHFDEYQDRLLRIITIQNSEKVY